jgi:hypothetical protein
MHFQPYAKGNGDEVATCSIKGRFVTRPAKGMRIWDSRPNLAGDGLNPSATMVKAAGSVTPGGSLALKRLVLDQYWSIRRIPRP